MNVTCHGHSTTIDERTVTAGPEGVASRHGSTARGPGCSSMVANTRSLIVDRLPAFANLEPGRHTVGCLYEGDVVVGEEDFEVVDPDGNYVDPHGDCRISGMADFEPKTVREDALVSAAARTWEVRVDRSCRRGLPGLRRRACVRRRRRPRRNGFAGGSGLVQVPERRNVAIDAPRLLRNLAGRRLDSVAAEEVDHGRPLGTAAAEVVGEDLSFAWRQLGGVSNGTGGVRAVDVPAAVHGRALVTVVLQDEADLPGVRSLRPARERARP